MPASIRSFEMVSMSDRLITAGGYTSTRSDGSSGSYISEIYQLMCDEIECKWNQFERKLSNVRANAITISIPDEYLTCENDS